MTASADSRGEPKDAASRGARYDADMTAGPRGLALRGGGDEPPPATLFCYGTLLDETFTARLLEHEVRSEPATLTGFATDELPGLDWPVLRALEGSAVEGRLYRGLGAEDFRRLDLYEGVAEGLYERTTVAVRTSHGLEPAAVYLPTRRTVLRYGG